MRRWWLRGDVALNPRHIVPRKSRVILVPECFPSGEIVVHHVRKGKLAALNDR
ncbi:MAG: hypothetical protein QOE41_3297, partial [Mycobacterium sp.]|nr:hypothetical protein [Mycobacterium sp.]